MSNGSLPLSQVAPRKLHETARLGSDKVLNPERLEGFATLGADSPVLVLLAAGRGTRFGDEPKCAQLVQGRPLARHSMDAFRHLSAAPCICVVGYRHEQVSAALGSENIYVRSENPVGGTAWAAYEVFSVDVLARTNPLLVITMGDRIVPTSIFGRLYDAHLSGSREADLTFLTATYQPPRNRGKGRILRDKEGRVMGIVEQRDIDAIPDAKLRQSLDDLTEGNCPLYAIRARLLRDHLEQLTNENAQGQFYLTDLIEAIRHAGGDVRTISTAPEDPEYALLCSDVTRPQDLAQLEQLLGSSRPSISPEVEQAAHLIRAGRPAVQVAALAHQLDELGAAAVKLGFKPDQPLALGISGGRLRIAFMHPDMGRFFGPAWQMPIGAGHPSGREQIVILMQSSEDRRIHLAPVNPELQEKVGSIPADIEEMYPGARVADWYTYEEFGTRMAERLLLSLGYFTDEEIQARKERGQPLPPSSLWLSASMRRPFSLVGNAIASMRTLRTGALGAKVQETLGRESFGGLRIVTGGDIPRGGFSSSSAVTVATKNAINALFHLGITPDMLIHLSCQAEYGTGVRAGSLDQATVQQGCAGQGTLLSSNPRDNYGVIGTYPVPAERFKMLFPYSVERDRAAWRWSAGVYAADAKQGAQTTSEMRKMTGKAAELAAILLRLPLDQDFFKQIENDLVQEGVLGLENRRWIGAILRQLPLLISRAELRSQIEAQRDWYCEQLRSLEHLDATVAKQKADATLENLFAGWREPSLPRKTSDGQFTEESGVPLRAMVAYLFGEVAKNFYLIHHPEEWIEWVSRSQWGDRSFVIHPAVLPDREAMESEFSWEKGAAGPALMERWLERFGSEPFDFNAGLDDTILADASGCAIHLMPGTNFFRGLALLDLVEAMLKRAFGTEAVALRVNAAGQGDFFQVHVDSAKVGVTEVKDFIRKAFYRRFNLSPESDFVEPHPGGGAVGLRLRRFDQLPQVVRALGVSRAPSL